MSSYMKRAHVYTRADIREKEFRARTLTFLAAIQNSLSITVVGHSVLKYRHAFSLSPIFSLLFFPDNESR